MEQNPPKLMTPFDCQTTPQWLYMLKLMLPYTPDNLQHSLAVFIRFQEMQYTMKYFNKCSKKHSHNTVLHDIKPYMDSSTQEMMEQMESMMSMMELLQNMQENTSDNPQDSNGFNPMDMFSEIMGNDISNLFHMKGNSEHE